MCAARRVMDAVRGSYAGKEVFELFRLKEGLKEMRLAMIPGAITVGIAQWRRTVEKAADWNVLKGG